MLRHRLFWSKASGLDVMEINMDMDEQQGK